MYFDVDVYKLMHEIKQQEHHHNVEHMCLKSRAQGRMFLLL